MPKVSHVWNTPVSMVLTPPITRPVVQGSEPVVLVPPRRRALTVGSDPSLTYAFDRVQDAWQTMAACGEFTEQTLDKSVSCSNASSATCTCAAPSSPATSLPI